MSISKWFSAFALVSTCTTSLIGETRCPGNVESLPYRVVNRHQIVVAVSIDHSGPYSFLLDTGTQMTMIDPTLADELHLSRQGEAVVASAGANGSASFARLDSAELGAHSVADMKVLVYELRNLQAAGLDIRGVVGEDLLERFDMLVDNAHKLVCLDDSGAMRGQVKGQHVPLLDAASSATTGELARSMIVKVRLSDGMRPVLLKLDSGTNTPFLYNPSAYMALGNFHGASLQGGSGGNRAYMALPPQEMKVGSVDVARVVFVTQSTAQKNTSTTDFDGLLPFGLFRTVFIDHADHFVVLDPW